MGTPEGKAALIRHWIEWFQEQLGAEKTLYSEIGEGMYICKGSDYFILVDDIQAIVKQFRTVGGLNMKKIRSHFTKQLTKGAKNECYDENGFEHLNGKCVKLTALVNDQIGECTEISLVAQILAQHMKRESYWVSGFLNKDLDHDYHVFNIMQKENKFFVFDATNQQISQIKEIENKEGILEIILEEQYEYTYSLN